MMAAASRRAALCAPPVAWPRSRLGPAPARRGGERSLHGLTAAILDDHRRCAADAAARAIGEYDFSLSGNFLI
jgi:hypothetical protein